MKRCRNGTRRRNGNCVEIANIVKKRCRNGTRRRNGNCVEIANIVKKRCRNGTRRHNGNCVSKTKPKTISSKSGKLSSKSGKKSDTQSGKIMDSGKYIITIHNSNGQQIKNMDLSIDDPNEFIEHVETVVNVPRIAPMNDSYIPNYIEVMNLNKTDIDDDELASIWFCDTDKRLQRQYDVEYNGKKYIVKFHNM
ncbi:MAG: hypothetical protein ACOVRN_13340 [Flavobacterium sp.]